jgi:ATP adenylyltransferase
MDHLWAPWRSTYLSATRDKSRCIFCAAAELQQDEKTLVVHRAKFNFVILNRYPYTSGHLMIAPYSHVSRLNQASEETTAEMMLLARFAEKTVEQIYRSQGLNVGMNLGELAG